jgi:hypothetical protein
MSALTLGERTRARNVREPSLNSFPALSYNILTVSLWLIGSGSRLTGGFPYDSNWIFGKVMKARKRRFLLFFCCEIGDVVGSLLYPSSLSVLTNRLFTA